jgi:curved DNA-binding protein
VKDYYSILGVSRTAGADEIKRAYRKLASQHHPDKGGDTARFQEIEEAYRVLSDPQQRAAHDNPQPQGFPGGFNFHNQPFDFNNIFNMFGTQFNPGQGRPRQMQARMSLWIQLADVASGGKRTVSVGSHAGNQIVELEIPLGVEDGASVAYPGMAPGGIDLVVTFRIHPNPRWQRDGFNLYTDCKVSVWTLITGGEITVRDILNRELNVTIPPMMQPGQTLRCRGRGLPDRSNNPGDMMIRVQAEIPQNIPQDLLALIRQQTGR